MGNRGILHDGNTLVRNAVGDDWIYCVTAALSDPKEFMAPGKFTDLFFLDEATALSAGHRPCAQCNHARFTEFIQFWKKTHDGANVFADDVDAELKTHRIQAKKQVTYRADARELPAGVMSRERGRPEPLLMFRYEHPKRAEQWCVYPWTSHGYGVKESRPEGEVEVLTPLPIVKIIDAGFTPGPVHPLLAW